jgi:hypothetical protein
MRVLRGDGYRVLVGGPVPPGASGITLGRTISVRSGREDDDHLMRHELVHVRQWRELGVVGFAARYLAAYLRGRVAGYGHWAAYRRIPLECEAEWEARRTRLPR